MSTTTIEPEISSTTNDPAILPAPTQSNTAPAQTPKKKARRKYTPDFYGLAPLPLKSTNAIPGSLAKIKIMEGRAHRQESIFHPHDAKITLEIHKMMNEEYAKLLVKFPDEDTDDRMKKARNIVGEKEAKKDVIDKI